MTKKKKKMKTFPDFTFLNLKIFSFIKNKAIQFLFFFFILKEWKKSITIYYVIWNFFLKIYFLLLIKINVLFL